MAEAQGPAPKTCTVCGTDVSGKPRVKDAQGRYMCKECFDKARATKGAQDHAAKPRPEAAAKPAPLADEDNSFLLGIGSSSIAAEGTAPCPECGRALTKNTIVCVGCGFNTQTGKRMQVKVTKERAPKGESGGTSASGGSIAGNPHIIGIVTLLAFAGMAVGVVMSPDFAPIYSIATSVFTFCVWIWVVVSAWQDETWMGILCLLCGIYALYWALVKSENVLQKWLYFVGILAQIMGILLNPQVLGQITGGGAGGP